MTQTHIFVKGAMFPQDRAAEQHVGPIRFFPDDLAMYFLKYVMFFILFGIANPVCAGFVSIDLPKNGDIVTERVVGRVTYQDDASDPIVLVKVFVNNAKYLEFTRAVADFYFDLGGVVNGTYELKVIAKRSSGKIDESIALIKVNRAISGMDIDNVKVNGSVDPVLPTLYRLSQAPVLSFDVIGATDISEIYSEMEGNMGRVVATPVSGNTYQFFLDALRMDPAHRFMDINIVSRAGAQVKRRVIVEVEEVAPGIPTLHSPVDGGSFTDSVYIYVLTLPRASVQLYINDKPYLEPLIADGRGVVSGYVRVPLIDGDYNFSVDAFNGKGRSLKSAPVLIKTNTPSPGVYFQFPRNDTEMWEPSNVELYIYKHMVRNKTLAVYVDGGLLKLFEDEDLNGVKVFKWDLRDASGVIVPDGLHTLSARVTNEAGKVSEVSVNIKINTVVDTVGPVIDELRQDGQLVDTSGISLVEGSHSRLTLLASDASSIRSVVIKSFAGNRYVSEYNMYSSGGASFYQDIYSHWFGIDVTRFVVELVDVRGNVSNIEYPFSIKLNKKRIPVITSPVGDVNVNSRGVHIEGQVSGYTRIRFYINDKEVDSPLDVGSGTSFSRLLTITAPNVKSKIHVATEFPDGEVLVSEPVYVTWVIQPPSITLYKPVVDAVISGDDMLVSGVISNPGSDPRMYETRVYVDGALLFVNPHADVSWVSLHQLIDLSGIPEGPHVLKIVEITRAGIEGVLERGFVLDRSADSRSKFFIDNVKYKGQIPPPSGIVLNGIGNISFDVVSQIGNVESVSFRRNKDGWGSAVSLGGGKYEFRFSTQGLALGEHHLTVMAVVTNGNVRFLDIPFNVISEPTLADVPVFTSPLHGSVLQSLTNSYFMDAYGSYSVRLLVNGVAVNEWAGSNGGAAFNAGYTFPGEGVYQIAAQGQNQHGWGPISPPITVEYSISSPDVTAGFVKPTVGEVIVGALPVEVSAAVTGADAISKMDLYLNNQLVRSLTSPPWKSDLNVSAFPKGLHVLKAIVFTQQGKRRTISQVLEIDNSLLDSDPPVVSDIRFNDIVVGSAGISVREGTDTGMLKFHVDDVSGIGLVHVDIGGHAAPVQNMGNGYFSVPYSVASGLPVGGHLITILVTDSVGNNAKIEITLQVTALVSAPSVPLLTAPVNGAQVSTAEIVVAGVATPESQVQLYINGVPVGSLVSVSARGGFGARVALPGEGTHILTGDARNSVGSSALSAPVQVVYRVPPPVVSFITPLEGADYVVGNVAFIPVSVLATAPDGVSEVQLSVDGQPLATLIEPPYTTGWSIGSVSVGSHTLSATAISQGGSSASVTRQIHILAPTAPVPPPVPYTGKLTQITPADSFGEEAVHIRGAAVNTSDGTAVSHAVLRLVLRVNGFERRINLASDAKGQFDYEFVPQASDSGSYEVMVRHPDEDSFTVQGHFNINRLSFKPGGYKLTSARGFPSPVTISASASAGSGATGVRWLAEPQHQPSGSLPKGIRIESGAAVNVPAGGTAPSVIEFTASQQAAETGTVILSAYANESGNHPRGFFTLNYRLMDARPQLYADPTYIETGVQQGGSVTEELRIGNRGLVAAQNVRLRLVDGQGNPPPSWVFLASASSLGALNVGAKVPVQISARPDARVPDGLYLYELVVSADNHSEGRVPISVAVTQSGQGNVHFTVSDLFTETVDSQGHRIEGVENVRIRLQNEAVPSLIYTKVTDARGHAIMSDLPPGTYIYRASGPRHKEKSGRLFIRPGVTTHERIHLSYQTISIEFSVTETTVRDRYDIVLEATYQTQVPAPVVLLEPLSVNLPELQVGEEFTGELTLTNYGLIQAENVKFIPPKNDAYYRYEFLANVPEVLPAKSRITLPYRVTALRLHPKALGTSSVSEDGWQKELKGALKKQFDGPLSSSCSGYGQWVDVTGEWVCINGEVEVFNSSSAFSFLSGAGCGGSSEGIISIGGDGGGDPGGFHSRGGGVREPTFLTPECMPYCPNCDCDTPGPGGGGSGRGAPGGL